MATSAYINGDSIVTTLATGTPLLNTNGYIAPIAYDNNITYSNWTQESYFNDKFLENCIKAVDKGIITMEQAFNLLRMIKSNDEESKELAKAILENAEVK